MNTCTVTYRGPTVLLGALAHLLREEGVDFDQPREDRTGLEAAAEVVLGVRAGDQVPEAALSARIDTAVAKFKKRFGEDAASVEVVEGEGRVQA